ncbi:CapA family protein [bacterium]|nr:CapA family protein [bacterium]
MFDFLIVHRHSIRIIPIILLIFTIHTCAFGRWILPADTITIVFGGDVMLSRRVGTLIDSTNVNYPFVGIKNILSHSDLAIVNLETTVGTRAKHIDKKYVFQAKPSSLAGLVWAGIDAVSLANNHIFDYFSAGVVETVDSVRNRGIVPLGAGKDSSEFFRPHSFYINGHWFAILGFNDTESGFWGKDKPGCAPTWTEWGESTAVAEISELSNLGAIVIVFEHWGWEYKQFPDNRQRGLAHKFIRAGAKIVVGSHPHRIQGIEFYRDGVIAYSLGNLIFDQNDSLGNIGAILKSTFINGNIDNVSIIPTETITQFARPQIANADSLLQYFRGLSQPLKTDVEIETGLACFPRATFLVPNSRDNSTLNR